MTIIVVLILGIVLYRKISHAKSVLDIVAKDVRIMESVKKMENFMSERMSDKLLPCPCCGHTGLYEIKETEELTGVVTPAIFCNLCKFTFKVENDSPYLDDYKTYEYLKEKTIKTWNTRKPISNIIWQLQRRIHPLHNVNWNAAIERAIEIIKKEGGLNELP